MTRVPLALLATLSPPLAAQAASPSLEVAAMGEFLTHPGVLVGAAQPLAQDAWGPGEAALLVREEAGAWLHPDNHLGLRLGAALVGRYAAPTGPSVELALGAGVMHSFLDGPVYAETSPGVLEPITDLGRPAFMPTASLAGAWQLSRLAPFLRVDGFGQLPFQRSLLPHVALLAGVRFDLSARSTP